MKRPNKHLVFLFSGLVLFFSCENEPVNQREVQELVARVNKKCPVALDSETTLLNVKLGDNQQLTYAHRLVNIDSAKVDTAMFFRLLWPGLLGNIKVDQDMAPLREAGYTFHYFYEDRAGKPVYTVHIRPQDYNRK